MTWIGFAIAICGGFWIFDPKISDSFGSPKLVTIALGALILWLGIARRGCKRSAVDIEILTLWAAMLASAYFGVDLPTSVFGLYTQAFHGLIFLATCTLIFYAARSLSWDGVGPFFVVTCWGLLGMAAFSVVQHFGILPEPFNLMKGRAIATIGNPVFLGATVAPAVPMAAFLAGWEQGWRRRLGIAALGAAGLLLWLCFSRGAWIAAAAGLWAMFCGAGRLRPRLWHFGAVAAILVAVMALSGRMGKGQSDQIRRETMTAAWAGFKEHPILGWGPDCFLIALKHHRPESLLKDVGDTVLVPSAHNDLVQMAVTTGIVGLLAYLWLAFSLAANGLWLIRFWDSDRVKAVFSAILGALTAIFVQAKVNPVPMTTTVLGAALAGFLASPTFMGNERGSRLRWGAGLLIAFFVVTFQAVQFRAEYLVSGGQAELRRGRIIQATDMIRRGQELAPWELIYSVQRNILIYQLAPFAEPARKKELMRRGLRVANAALKLHPVDPRARNLLATSLMYSAAGIGPGLMRDALREIKAASDYEPLLGLAAQQWAIIAEMLGDFHERALAKSRLTHINAVADGKTQY